MEAEGSQWRKTTIFFINYSYSYREYPWGLRHLITRVIWYTVAHVLNSEKKFNLNNHTKKRIMSMYIVQVRIFMYLPKFSSVWQYKFRIFMYPPKFSSVWQFKFRIFMYPPKFSSVWQYKFRIFMYPSKFSSVGQFKFRFFRYP